jgi:hypothetical protein
MSAKQLPGIPFIQKGTYRHSKTGNYYEVVGVALHSETLEPLVVYRPHYESTAELFARPYDMFVGTIEIDGFEHPRFERISDATT